MQQHQVTERESLDQACRFKSSYAAFEHAAQPCVLCVGDRFCREQVPAGLGVGGGLSRRAANRCAEECGKQRRQRSEECPGRLLAEDEILGGGEERAGSDDRHAGPVDRGEYGRAQFGDSPVLLCAGGHVALETIFGDDFREPLI